MCDQHKRYEDLTQREREVFNYIKKGMSNKEIAKALNITEETAQKHVNNILAKFNVHDRKKIIANEF